MRNRMTLLESTPVCPKHLSMMPPETILARVNDCVDPCELCEKENFEAWQDYKGRNAAMLQEIIVAGAVIIYIAGPMTGHTNFNKPAFHLMERLLKTVSRTVFSPAKHPENMPYSWYMSEDIQMLIRAHGVVFLHGWETSRGAKLEHDIAEITEKKVYYEQ